MITYPKILRKKDLKKISKYSCEKKIKEYYIKFLTNFPFDNFVEFCKTIDLNDDMEDVVLDYLDYELDKYEENTQKWAIMLLTTYLVYFDVNFDLKKYHEAFISLLQTVIISFSFNMSINDISFDEVSFPEYCDSSFEKLFKENIDFEFDLSSDCSEAFKFLGSDFDFSCKEFYTIIKSYFIEKGFKRF